MSQFIMAAQLITGLSILVLIHELGHYLAARAFGIRVEKFYLFFDWKFRLFKFKKGDTEYGIGWIPLGGYVKIAGMIDESMDKEQLKKPPQPYEFRSKPAWQRLIVMIAGVVMNLILGMIIFGFVTWYYEKEYLPNDQLTNGIYAYQTGRDVGFETGDKIVAVNGDKINRFKDAFSIDVILGATVTVERNGEFKDIIIPDDFYKTFTQEGKRDFFIDAHNYSCILDTVMPGMNAFRAPFSVDDEVLMVDTFCVESNKEAIAIIRNFGNNSIPVSVRRNSDTVQFNISVNETGYKEPGIQKNDLVLAVDSVSINSWGQLREVVSFNKGKTVEMLVLRNNDSVLVQIPVDTNGLIGIYCKPPYSTKHYSFLSAMSYGTSDALSNLMANVKGLGKIISGKENASDSVKGPIGIARIYGGVWEWSRFWLITGIISLILAFMNMLPIPALDGGHVIFTTIELITGKKFSDKFMEKAQLIGMFILLALMAFAIGNDIWTGIFK